MKRLEQSRRCHHYVEGLPESALDMRWQDAKSCPNYVNMRKPRRAYWERGNAEKVCWAYICDWCFEDLEEWEEGWPTGDSGQFKGSMECSLP